MKYLILFVILTVLEYPLIKRYIKAKNDYDFSRQFAVIILMGAMLLLIVGFYRLINNFVVG